MSRLFRRALLTIVGAGWAAGVAVGVWQLRSYADTAGAPARPGHQLPDGVGVARGPGLPALVLLIHPRCPCSRATVGELARLMADCHGRLSATVLMVRPDGAPDDWAKTGLWRDAAAIPGVTVVADGGGRASRGFGAATSGQALLYAADRRLLFAGGITEARGHSGDNAGRSTVTSLVLGGARGARGTGAATTRPAATPVYGCPLFDDASACLDNNMVSGNDE
jgi:hypothetical protein